MPLATETFSMKTLFVAFIVRYLSSLRCARTFTTYFMVVIIAGLETESKFEDKIFCMLSSTESPAPDGATSSVFILPFTITLLLAAAATFSSTDKVDWQLLFSVAVRVCIAGSSRELGRRTAHDVSSTADIDDDDVEEGISKEEVEGEEEEETGAMFVLLRVGNRICRRPLIPCSPIERNVVVDS